MKLLGLEFHLGHSFYPSMYGVMIEGDESFSFVPVMGLFGIGFLTFIVTGFVIRILQGGWV